MKAIILSAGQGRRLMPLTEVTPKCCLQPGGVSILEWQITQLAVSGVTEVVVVTGFGHDIVEDVVSRIDGIRVRTLYNPFFRLSDNLGTCWVARGEMDGPFLLINGDTLFDPRIARRVLDNATAPISVTVDAKGDYDSDDMKVRLDGDRLTDIGKRLPPPIHGESIGMLRFRGAGGGLFASVLETVLADNEALKLWYLSIIDRIAKSGEVGFVSIEGLPWAEVDFPEDVPIAAGKVAGFAFSKASAA